MLLVQWGMTSFSLNFFSNQIQCSHVFLIIQFLESSNLIQSYFTADETRDFPCIAVLPENPKVVVAQWVRHWSSDRRVVQAEGSSPDRETLIKYFGLNFISVLLGLIDFSDIVMLRSGPNSCCQQNLKCFDMPLLLLGLFS